MEPDEFESNALIGCTLVAICYVLLMACLGGAVLLVRWLCQ